jgi:hypothetical protein
MPDQVQLNGTNIKLHILSQFDIVLLMAKRWFGLLHS